MLLGLLWAELSVSVPHELRFEDVAAAAVLPEEPIVQIHFQTGCLEVQSHFRKEGNNAIRRIPVHRLISESSSGLMYSCSTDGATSGPRDRKHLSRQTHPAVRKIRCG